MSKVHDFNLLKVGESNVTSSNTNTVSVVVNADTSGNSGGNTNFTIPPTPIEPGNVIYPPPTPPAPESPSILPQGVTVNLPPQEENSNGVNQSEFEFYQLLSSILSDMLKDNNPKLIVNLIDTSGKIIIKAADLIRLIAIKTNNDVKDVNLRYCDDDPGCCAKISPVKLIEDIKIKNESFNLKYNAEYNILKDNFNISLTKVIIF